jgi:hypothetical protein
MRWVGIALTGLAAATWITTLFVGFYIRRGLWTIELDDGAATIWNAVPNNSSYARINSTKTFQVVNHDLNSYVPMFTTAAGRFHWMARIPFWMPLVLTSGAAGILWWKDNGDRRRRLGLCITCGYDRRGIDASAPCPECGRAPAT